MANHGWCRVRIRLVLTSSMYSCYACNFYFQYRYRKPLLFVFSNHSKNVYQPSWRDSAADNQPVFLAFKSLSCDWECKGKQKFWTDKRKVKILIFSSARFSILSGLLSKRGAKVASFFRLPKAIFRILLERGDNTHSAFAKWGGLFNVDRIESLG